MTLPVGPTQIPSQYLFVLAECVEDFGIDKHSWLGGIEDPAVLTSCTESLVSFELFETLALRAARMANNPALGFSVGQRLTLASHGVLGYALTHCENIIQAATIIEKYISIRMPLIRCSTAYEGDEFVVLFEENTALTGNMRTLLIDALLLTVKVSLDQLMPSLHNQFTVGFPYKEHKLFPYQSLFGCQLRFCDRVASIRIPENLTKKRIKGSNAFARQEAEVLCKKERDRQFSGNTYTVRIQNKLLEKPGNFPNLDVVASWFNLTQRTLHRRLIDENTSYKQIVEDIKRSLAISYLTKSSIPIKEISFFLNYQEPANFRRAFVRWTSHSPSSYRSKFKP